eukprot:970869-Lingulodinium_polyedra.AAC.1
MKPEFKYRAGQGQGAYVALKKRVLPSQHLDVDVKDGFVATLIDSRVFHACQAWTPAPDEQYGTLDIPR